MEVPHGMPEKPGDSQKKGLPKNTRRVPWALDFLPGLSKGSCISFICASLSRMRPGEAWETTASREAKEAKKAREASEAAEN